jgi:hypothetical protein
MVLVFLVPDDSKNVNVPLYIARNVILLQLLQCFWYDEISSYVRYSNVNVLTLYMQYDRTMKNIFLFLWKKNLRTAEKTKLNRHPPQLNRAWQHMHLQCALIKHWLAIDDISIELRFNKKLYDPQVSSL